MASKADSHAIELLVSIAGITGAMRGNRIVQELLDTVNHDAYAAILTYSDTAKLSCNQFKTTSKRLSSLVGNHLDGEQDIRKILSWWQLCLVDMLALVKNEKKRKALDRLYHSINALIGYYGKVEETHDDELIYEEGVAVARAFNMGW